MAVALLAVEGAVAYAAAPPARPPRAEGWTPWSYWVANDDGTVTRTIFPDLTFHTGADGRWAPIDPTVVPAPGDLAADVATVPNAVRPLTFGRTADRLLTLDLDGGAITLSAPGATVDRPSVDGNAVGYVLPGAHAELGFAVDAGGVKQTVTLHDETSPTTYRFRLSDPNGVLGDAVPTGDGGYRFDRPVADGLFLTIPAPVSYELGDRPVAERDARGEVVPSAHLRVVKRAGGFDVVESVDPAWLARHEFPVVLDPTLTFAGPDHVVDCAVTNNPAGVGTPNCDSATAQVGADTTGASRLLLRYDTSSFPSPAQVTGASVLLTASSVPPNGVPVSLYPAGAAWTTGATWFTRDGFTPWGTGAVGGAPGAFLASATMSSTTAPATLTSANLKTLVTGWINGTTPNNGLVLMTPNETAPGPGLASVRMTEDPATTSRPALQVTYIAPPDKPANVTATRGDHQATVSWTTPANNGSAITGYNVRAYSGTTLVTTQSAGPTATSAVIGSLTNGTSYTFKVTASNSIGTGPESDASNAVTPAGVPFVPTNVAATGGDQQATVTWTAAGANGDPLTANTVTAYAGAAAVTTATVGGTATSATVTGLTNGTLYTFKVHATNTVGSGSQSSASNAVVPAGPPLQPTGVSAAPGNASATVSWTAADPNGSTVTGNTISAYAGATLVTSATVGAVTSGTVTGLINGTAYTFKVAATNAFGTGPQSAASNAVVAGVPGTATNVTATAGDQSATVSWTAAPQNGGAVTAHAVRAYAGTTLVSTTNVGNVTTATVTGLTNGTAYTFRIVATNGYGSGAESAASAAVTPAGLPFAPGNVTASAGDTEATVTWTAANANGSPVTGYTVRLFAGATQVGSATVPATATSKTFTGLTNGTVYHLTVAATNAVGTGPAGTSNTVTPAGVPGTPGSVDATAGDQSLSVTWTAPGPNGSAITGYTITTYTGTTLVSTTTAVAGATSQTVTGLANGTAYYATVAATNNVGTGPAGTSDTVTPAGQPTPPTSVGAARGDQSAVVSWSGAGGNGSAITAYQVKTYQGATLVKTDTFGSATSATVTGLVNGTAYTFKVAAVNGVGTSADSAASSAVTPAGTPFAPSGVSATAGNGQASVTWTAPSGNGSPVTGYRVEAYDGATLVKTDTVGTGTSATVTGLANGTTYTFQVAATNAVGTGPRSAASNAVTPAGLPGAPAITSTTPGNASTLVAWSAAAANGSAIVSYTVKAFTGSTLVASASIAAPATSGTVTGLGNGTSYTYRVSATNGFGEGPDSGATAAETAGIPGKPVDVTVTRGDQQVTLAWTAAPQNGGALTGYVIQRWRNGAPDGSTTASGTATGATVTGLTNDASYVFVLWATNVHGTGRSSDTTAPVVPAGVPFAPPYVFAIDGDQQASVFWNPAYGNGSPVTGYTVRAYAGATPAATTTVGGGATSAVVTGLVNGTTYTFTVTAANAVGGGAPGTSNAVTCAGSPSAPSSVSATPGDTTIAVTWGTPSSTNGAPLTAYRIKVTRPDGTTFAEIDAEPGQSQATVTGLTNGVAYDVGVAGVNRAGTGAFVTANDVTPVAATVPAGSGEYVPLPPARIVDTRTGLGGSTTEVGTSAQSFTVVGVGGVPDGGVTAVAVAVTVITPPFSTDVTVWPAGRPQPATAAVTTQAEQTTTGLVVAKVGALGRISVVLAGGSAHVLFDVQGYYTDGTATTGASKFVPLTPARVADTTTGLGNSPNGTAPVGSNSARAFTVTGTGGVPASGVSAVAVAVTAASPVQDGTFTVYRDGDTRPGTTNVSFVAGQGSTSLVEVPVSDAGRIAVYNGSTGTTHVKLDIEGYYTRGSGGQNVLVPVNPARIYSTVTGQNTGGSGTAPLGTNTTRSVLVAGATDPNGVQVIPPTGVAAAVLSVHAVKPQAAGYFQGYPDGEARPEGGILSYSASGTVTYTSTFLAKVGPTGRVNIYASAGTVGLVVEVMGYFAAAPPAPPGPPTISSSTYPQNAWATSIPATPTFTFSAASSDVDHFLYAIDDPSLTSPAAAYPASGSSSATVNYTAPGGWHTMYAQAVDTKNGASAVTSYVFGGDPGITSPVTGSSTQGSVNLTARAKSGYTGVRWQYRRGTAETFADIPVADVTKDGAAVTAWPVATATSGIDTVAPTLVWNVAKTLGTDGSVEVQACYSAGATTRCTNPASTLRLDRSGDANPTATAPFGPGTLNLVTGNLAIAATDVSIDSFASDLTVTRSYHTGSPIRSVPGEYEHLSANQVDVESGTAGFTASPGGSVLLSAAIPSYSQSNSLKIQPWGTGASNETYASIGGDGGALRLTMQPGHSYTFTTHIYVPSSTGLAPASAGYNITRADRAVAFFGSTAMTEVATPAASATDTWQRLSMRFTVPANATQAYIRLYNGRLQTGNSAKHVLFDRSSLTDEGVFGPGWISSLPVGSAGAAYAGLDDLGTQVNLHQSDGSVVVFTKNSAGEFVPTGDDGTSGVTLKPATITNGTAATWTLTDLGGNSVVFAPSTTYTSPPTTAAAHAYRISSATQPGSSLKTTYAYANGRISEMLAPVPAGVTCTGGSWGKGCRSLQFSYNANGHLTAVVYKTANASGAALLGAVACYAYDEGVGTGNTGRLTQSWDPRIVTSGGLASSCGTPVLPTSYGYDGSGRLASVTSPGLAPFVLGYDSAGRVTTVTRTHGFAFGGGSEVSTVRYGISTAPDASFAYYRPNLTAAAVAAWGQTDPPVTGVAFFGPGDAVSTTDLRTASVRYLSAGGRVVNTASFGGASDTDAANWHVDMTQYDKNGAPVQTLTAANRALALNPSAAPPGLTLPSGSAAAAAALSSVSIYSADGMDLVDTFGPYHLAIVPGSATPVGVRTHTHHDYDTGAELAHPAGPRLHLEVAGYTAASRSAAAVATSETDKRTTVTRYALTAADASGWTFRKPMQVVVDPDGLALTTVTRYDPATGAVVETRQPSNPNGDGAGSTRTLYYTADGSSPDSACRNRPEWASLLCKQVPVAQPAPDGLTSGLVGRPTRFVQAYDYLSRPTTVVETPPGAPARTSTTTYENGGFSPRVSQLAITGGVGTAVPTKTTTYDQSTGLPTTVAAAATADQAATTITTSYDDFGRTVSYDDGSGAAATTTTYDSSGRVKTVSDAKGSRTYTYNGTGERRGLPTSVVVSGVGTFSAAYGPDGAFASQSWPNGLVQTYTRDQAGRLVNVRAVNGSTVWLDETVSANAHGQWRSRAATIGAASGSQGGSWTYDYDQAGRLTKVTDDPAGATPCTTRTYAFDTNSNRVRSASYPAGAGGACQSSTGGTAVTHRYDTADRLLGVGIDAGLAYDAFGRITSLPERATTELTGSPVTVTYYAHDLARSVSRGTATQRWTLDAAGRFATRTDLTGGTETGRVVNHYSDASDSPTWVGENAAGTAFTRNVAGLGGSLAATVDEAGTVSWKVSNLHGDVVATAVGSVTAPATGYVADEFGVPQGATPGRYGWLGAKQRAGGVLGGLTLMGVRLYAPVIGRFLQVDPVPGGNANAYEYPNDPVNGFDLDGRWGVNWRGIGNSIAGGAKTAASWTWDHKDEILLGAGIAAAGVCVVASAGVCGGVLVGVAWTTAAANGGDIGYKMAKGTLKASDVGWAAFDAVTLGESATFKSAAKQAVRYMGFSSKTNKVIGFRSVETAFSKQPWKSYERWDDLSFGAAQDVGVYIVQRVTNGWW